MFDARLRPLIDPPLDRLARLMVAAGISANAVTLIGVLPGLAAAIAITQEAYWIAVVLILLNRLADGLDGAVARRLGPTDFGGYLDIVFDFVFYAVIPLAFAFANPQENALAATVLICSFVGTGSSFLAYAILAEKRKITTDIRGRKSFYYLGGLTEGTETIAVFLAFCIFPQHFTILALIFASLCWMTTLTRILAARLAFAQTEQQATAPKDS